MIRQITIVPVINGFTVAVGCQTLVFVDPADLVKALADYLADPAATEQRYRETALNKSLLNSPVLQCAPGYPTAECVTAANAACPQWEGTITTPTPGSPTP